ncbi:DUF3857 domain-containing protein [Altericroceibacterium endophyticum]|uniref:DUF3857 domain-containing protein n=1 Tax=Altericroceibacterium endophyticum TaxID=1808508 RepID=A0A6I4T3B4_9SPHN|nr:DUF3857 domain-containing protein [Altericroceibacterium endophyticum]MXO65407.1 DUF3857 domain-containing protein [Altericroceibacterium endophyticum]
MRRIFMGAALILVPNAALADDEVHYGAPAQWVAPPPQSDLSPPKGGAFFVEYNDQQAHLDQDGLQIFSTYRVKLLRPEALQVGNINLVWQPDMMDVTVHRVRIIREGEEIDVLADQKFNIFQREGRLEQSMLDGLLTANLQVSGLRVGDTIEFAQTLKTRDLTFGNRDFGMMLWPAQLGPGLFRMRLEWEDKAKPRWHLSPDLAEIIKRSDHSIEALLTNPGDFNAPDRAPVRYKVGRMIQFSDFSDWQSVSREAERLYETSGQLDAVPELREEARRIRRENATEAARAKAALKLVQNQIRYVYSGMDGGNFTPATVAETWDRRFGDCKGKTVMLLALLREMGIEAEAVLVPTGGGDGYDAFLPSPDLFDHVLVRSRIDGKRGWLDGTRTGDPRLMRDHDVGYRFVLPLSTMGNDLLEMPFEPRQQPSELTYIDIDASAGTEQPADVTSVRVLRGDGAIQVGLALQSLPEDQALQRLKTSGDNDWLKVDDVSWTFDGEAAALRLTYEGTAELDWDEDKDGDFDYLTYYLPGGGFYKPAKLERPADQDQDAPFANDPNRFSCSVTRMVLPELTEGRWTLTARAINENYAGVDYYRSANLDHGVVRLLRSSRTVQREIPAAASSAINAKLEAFDNDKVMVNSENREGDSTEIVDPAMPDLREVDWMYDTAACTPGAES